MRKIETEMNAAISEGRDWSKANTSVHWNEDEGIAIVRLHGNKIAEIGEGFITLFDGGWQSNTTKSRLNALLDEFVPSMGIFQKNWTWFLSDRLDGSVVPFANGVTL